MPNKQFKAGYIADSIAKVISDFKRSLNEEEEADKKKLGQINGLLKNVSAFDVDFQNQPHSPNFENLNPVLAVMNNIFTRGLPTRSPLLVERVFSEIGLTQNSNSRFELEYPQFKELNFDFETVFELFHITEPGLEVSRESYGGNLGSEAEWTFLDKRLQDFPYVKQILQSQRDFATIHGALAGGRSVDFSFEYPYQNTIDLKSRQGVIFEVDGSHHDYSYKIYDAYRDDAAIEEGFETLREPVANSEAGKETKERFQEEIFQIFKKNYERNPKDNLDLYSLIFIPLSVARVQKTLIEIFLSKPDLLKHEKLQIAIIERDFPCAALALEGLEEMVRHLNALVQSANEISWPVIELTVFDEHAKWLLDERLHLDYKREVANNFQPSNYDLILDHSILRRSNTYNESTFATERAVRIRSAHFYSKAFGEERRVYCAELLKYNQLVFKKDDGSFLDKIEYKEHIEFFLQNIFRKTNFRIGQLPIISRALRQEPVIGLLPTGGGKSLTFQLAAFLQPGLCMVVDPIKSLMEDQVRVLNENWIDFCDYINSNLDREEKGKRIINERYGENLFFFISPERYVMQDFRTMLGNIGASSFGLAFSYCVIDEVHCVSEWGHDFRTTYLMLGRNAQQFTRTKDGRSACLVGLTATASFDVLADIERELKIEHDEAASALVMIENTIRPELFFRVLEVGENRSDDLNNEHSHLATTLRELNDEELIKKSLDHHEETFEEQSLDLHEENFEEQSISYDELLIKDNDGSISTFAGVSHEDLCSIIFCPVKGQGGHANGVDTVFQNLNSDSKVYFYSDDDEAIAQEIRRNFKRFLQGKKNHMVCTKAFGMGIDKDDIRATFHYSYPPSLESLVQEAGRAGRDRRIALSTIFFSGEEYYAFDISSFFKDNQSHAEIQNRFNRMNIRNLLETEWEGGRPHRITFNSKDDFIETVSHSDLKGTLKELVLNDNAVAQYFTSTKSSSDRDTHTFFHKLAFRGSDIEQSQLLNLIKIPDKELNNGLSLAEYFNGDENSSFAFQLRFVKMFTNTDLRICQLLNITPDDTRPHTAHTNKAHVKFARNASHNFYDFLLRIEEKNLVQIENLGPLTKDRIEFLYHRDRSSSNETGRLIYRMHCMGLIEDFIIDYNNELYECTFRRYKTIEDYLDEIERYLLRYQSEKSARKEKKNLENRLKKEDLVEDIISCLNFLSEFSDREIADKRRRATDEVEKMLRKSVTEVDFKSDWYKQNIFLKEHIYFYFNAKYARKDFQIDGNPFYMTEDYRSVDHSLVLKKYLDALFLDGSEQNNYKHMIGSCKRIMTTDLSKEEVENDWLLRILKAFAMYATNNPSYLKEAHEDVERGFENLYSRSGMEMKEIRRIFHLYFDKLLEHIEEQNEMVTQVKMIQHNILMKLLVGKLNNIIENYQTQNK